MKQECAWDNIKHDLRNILVSNKIAMTVNELTYKFKKMTGKPIPFELLGYPDIECFLMDLPDVLNTIWFQGELRLQCKRDPTDIHVEALVNVVKNGKVPNFGGFGKNIPIENQIEIFIPREWQNKIENIIKSIAETGCSISKLESVLIEQCVEIPNERITLVGALRRCWNLKVNVEKTIVYIRYRADVLKIYIDKLLNNFPDGILLDQFEKTFQKFYDFNLNCKKFGFECVFNMFKYYASYFTILSSGNGLLKIFSKNFLIKLHSIKSEPLREFIGIVKCVNNPNSFWIIPINHPIASEINCVIKDLLGGSQILETPKIGNFALAQSQKFSITASRCVILEINECATVLFVDFGIVDTVSLNELIEIPKDSKLLTLPRLAIHAKLGNVKSRNKEWCTESIEYFFSCLRDKSVFVTVLAETKPPVPVQLNRYPSNIDGIKPLRGHYIANIAEDMAIHKYAILEQN